MNSKIKAVIIFIFAGLSFILFSCSNAEIEGELYISIPKIAVFTDLEIQVYNESGASVINKFGIKNYLLDDQMLTDIKERFPDSDMMNDIDGSNVYLTELDKSSNYDFNGTFAIFNDTVKTGEYDFNFSYGYVENDNIDFTLYNSKYDEPGLKGFATFTESAD
jgi:hypothetical protein